MSDHEAMLAIQQELDGTEWTADKLGRVAEILQCAGYRIRDLDDRNTRAVPILAGSRDPEKLNMPEPGHVLAALQEDDVRDWIAAILKINRDFGDLTPDAVSGKDIHDACLAVAATADFSKEIGLAAFSAALTALGEATRRRWGNVPILTAAACQPVRRPRSRVIGS